MLLRVSHVLLSCGERRSGGIARGAGGTHVLDAVEQCEQTARVGAARQTQGEKLLLAIVEEIPPPAVVLVGQRPLEPLSQRRVVISCSRGGSDD